MGIEYTDRLEAVRAPHLEGFFVGWPKHPDRDTHLEILRRSHAVWLAFDGERCVGFVNALSDGVFYAHIPLLEVVPDYQGRGIGAELLRRMAETLSGLYAVDALCDEAVAPFYQAHGFERCVGMARRNYAMQDAPAARAGPPSRDGRGWRFTDEVLALLKRSVLCWLATVDGEGFPSVSPKEVFAPLGDSELLIADIASPGSVSNARAHPRVCASVVDVFVQKGVKLYGTATVVDSAMPEFADLERPLAALAGDAFVIRHVLHVRIERAVPILAPSYRFVPGTTEESQVRSAMSAYGVLPDPDTTPRIE